VDLAIKFTAGITLRRQLEQALRVAIRSGRLAPGSLLPSSRDLAEELAVSRGVVVDSYSQLAAEGYLSARRGSGTRVASLPESAGPPVRRQLSPPARFRYDLRPGQADFHAFPRDRWKAALDRALRQLPDMRLTYADHRGVPELRNAVAEYLTRVRGVVAEPDHVIVCCAASHALTVLWRALRHQGARRVAVEDPGCAHSAARPSRPALRRSPCGWTPAAWSSQSSPPPTSMRWCSPRRITIRPEWS
jgi:GntR family transcriptional regulator / MocR family aminotransferase